jgi:hypothetical protein
MVELVVVGCCGWRLVGDDGGGGVGPVRAVSIWTGFICVVAEREPVWWVAAALAALLFALAFALRTRPAFPAALGCAVLAAGFATAAIKARLLDHPVLRATAYSVSVKGFVEAREERERSDCAIRSTPRRRARVCARTARTWSPRSTAPSAAACPCICSVRWWCHLCHLEMNCYGLSPSVCKHCGRGNPAHAR